MLTPRCEVPFPLDDTLRSDLRAMLEAAGAVALASFRRVRPERKADGTVVTDADRRVEEVLVAELARRFPGESVVSEEGGRIEGRPGGATWYVDPIDGTGGFVAALAYWGPTVCRVDAGRLHAGGFYVPRLREHWTAEAGGGAWRDDDRLGPAEPAPIGRDDILFVPSRFHRRPPVPWPGKVRALGSSAAHLCHVAAGSGLAAFVPRWSLWDVGLGVLAIRESGRVIWDAHGSPVEPESVPHHPPSAGAAGLPLLAGAPIALRTLCGPGSWAESVVGARRKSDGG